MWLEDLMVATKAMIDLLGECHGCYAQVLPCWDGGIVFSSTNGEIRYKWFPDGHIEKHEKGDWRLAVKKIQKGA